MLYFFQGWKPMRTIVFGSWDGEEIGVIGSTEWVEVNVLLIKYKIRHFALSILRWRFENS